MERMAQAFQQGFHAVKDKKDKDECAACHVASCNKHQFVGVMMPHKGNKAKSYTHKKENN
eukprot:CAMPEP_0172478446 /NCGR_PEP_ID=MMETSP1066-20121228/2423_1 /TAXON_ID=671091 /ORGANISM="Coscinodiscus wailesii, Strain CCMP2513" /LENGTH=59 /DNA_ID=CAMNT_0013238027 /DNA_START=94 /DNA_END=273 /DNA_ORIENTATION=+